LGVPAARILFVGDDPDLDVHAPRAVGMRAAWINRRGMPWPERLRPPELIVRDCTELAAALDGQ
jgi:putative hydrolase of the HAD superfamily